VISQDYPKDNLEILVIDGNSKDKSVEVINAYIKNHGQIRLFNNKNRIIPSALNIGIKESRGVIIIRFDAHSFYPKEYITKCVNHLLNDKVDNVGGICVTIPSKNNPTARAIAAAMSNFFGVGNSYFRIGVKEPRTVDTVPFGCYRKELFSRIGFFDEELLINEDAEFNNRLTKSGGKILLAPDITSYYYARDSYIKLSKMYFNYGYYRVLTVRKTGKIIGLRQLIPALFLTSLFSCFSVGFFLKIFMFLAFLMVSFYFLVNLAVSILISLKEKKIILLPFLVIAFLVIHFSYGAAYLRGIFDFIILRRNVKKQNLQEFNHV